MALIISSLLTIPALFHLEDYNRFDFTLKPQIMAVATQVLVVNMLFPIVILKLTVFFKSSEFHCDCVF